MLNLRFLRIAYKLILSRASFTGRISKFRSTHFLIIESKYYCHKFVKYNYFILICAFRTNKEAKVHNFYQIENSLRLLKVVFDAKLTHQIMNEERGASLRLLYQLKLGIERYFSNKNISVTGIQSSLIDEKVKLVKELAITLPKIHKQYGV